MLRSLQTRRSRPRHPSLKTICIYGAGALGGAIAAKLALGLREQATVSVVAHAARIWKGIRTHGMRVWEAGAASPLVAKVKATDNAEELPPQDLVITGLKGHQLGAAVPGLAKLLHAGTRVVMVLNGILLVVFSSG